MTRIAILVSGRGSNMQRLVETCEQQLPTVKIVLIASNKSCAGIDYAKARNLPTALVSHQTHDNRRTDETALADAIDAATADWIFLAGYMVVLSADFVRRYAGRMLNIHPSLLPAFKGLNTHQRALDAGETHHGASVHVVTAALDDGPVILQARLKINKGETGQTLAGRVLKLEHQLFPFVLVSLVSGILTISDGVPNWQNSSEILDRADPATRSFLGNHAIWPT